MFVWPIATLVDRVVSKSKILEKAKVPGRLKSLMTDQIREIRWLAKLAPETIKLPATPQVAEIAIFRISLKGDTLSDDLLDLLDKAMAPPILFAIVRADGKVSHSAAFKRPSEADASQWVTSHRHRTAFREPTEPPPPLPASLDLGRLYSAILAPLLPLGARAGEHLTSWIDRCAAYEVLRRKIDVAVARVRREKQFNRKVELNRELNALKSELEALNR